MLDLPGVETLDSFESMCDAGNAAREQSDNARWYIGELALRIGVDYGEKMVEEFARRVGIAKSTAYQYRSMCVFYNWIDRSRDDNITYSHMRDAKRLGNVDLAREWLEFVSANGWSVDEASWKLTEKLGKTHPIPNDDRDYIVRDVLLADVNLQQVFAQYGLDVYVTIYTRTKVNA